MHTADELCDRVAFLVDGQIRLIDSPRALKLRHGRRIVRVETTSGPATDFPLDGLAGNEAFLTTLRGGVQTIHSQETTLEEIFIAVTGRELQ
jgi:fluoroquinolone transport system ATP-binding protein